MSDFQVKVGADFSEVLRGFQQLPQEAAKAGQGIGKGLGDGIQGAGTKSVAALTAELNKLQQRQTKLSVDSSEFVQTNAKIKEVQALIAAVERDPLKINADATSIIALRSRLNELQGELEKTQIGSQRFRELQVEIRKTEGDLRDAGQSAGGLQGVIQSLGPAIAAIGIGAGLATFTRNAFDAAVAAESAEVRIKALGDQFGEADKIQQMVAASAKQLNITNTEAADGFLQLYGALRPTGISLDDIGTVFTATNAAAKNFGLSAGSVQAAVLQLSQGLAAGTLQGDELRSIMEQMPPVAQAIAKEMGITVGEVKKFGSEGKITSDIVIKAIKGMNEVELGKLSTTLSSTQERINAQRVAWNELSVTVGNVFVQASLPVIEALTSIAKGLADAAQAAINAPAPLKALAAVLIGLPAAYITARLAVIAFNSELVGGQIKAAIAGIQQLGVLLKTQFVADLATAKAAWAAFSTSVQTGALQQQIGALTAKFGPLALAIGSVVLAVDTYNRSTADSRSIAESAAAGQDQLTAALVAAGVETRELTTLGGPFARAMQDNTDAIAALLAPLKGIPGIGPLVAAAIKGIGEAALNIIPGLKGATDAIAFLFNAWKKSVADANATQGLEQATTALLNLQNQAASAENAAGKLFAELQQAGGSPNTEQTEQIKQLITALDQARGNGKALAKQFDELAAAARNSGNKEYAEELERLAKAARDGIPLADTRIKQLESLIPVTERKTAATQADTAAVKAQAAAEAELNQIIAEAPVRNLEAQLAVGQQLVGLAKALADQEQSRFAVVKAGLEFELASAEKRGASEAEIGRIKQGIQELDRQSAEARFKALTQQQQLETQMLALAQEKARVEADLSATEARVALLEAESKLADATTTQAKEAAQAQINLQKQIVGIRQEQKDLLAQTQPIEQQILAAQQETAINGEKTRLAQEGYKIAADGSVVATARLAAESAKTKEQAEALKTVQSEISDIIAETTLRQATQQVAVGEKLLGLALAIGSEEQSRFDLLRGNLEFELKKAEERGASESEIASIKQRIQETDKKAAEARYASLLQQQQLEAQMLEITQRKQVIEANLEVRQQQIALLEAEQKLREAMLSGDQNAIAVAGQQRDLQRMRLGLAGDQLNVLGQTLPIERQMLAAQQQTAINALQAQAAQNGYQLAAATSAVNLNNLANSAGRFGDLVGVGAANQRQLQSYMSITVGDATKVVNSADQLKGALDNAQTSAGGMADGFTSTSNKAPSIVQGSRDFAAYLFSAKDAGELIARLPLEGQMASVATHTQQAANAAKVFYEWLQRASSLPGSRWTGGPVEAGDQYRVNELGQEALLSGGRLRLITAAPNSIWRAPANGTVIPAGITAKLQEQGALPGGSGGGGGIMPLSGGGSSAQLAIEVGKLRQEVGELVRKQWNVNIQTRTGPTGSQVLKQMLR